MDSEAAFGELAYTGHRPIDSWVIAAPYCKACVEDFFPAARSYPANLSHGWNAMSCCVGGEMDRFSSC